jgi:hypothetical protein
MRSSLVGLALLAASSAGEAQSLAARVSQAPDGMVRMEFVGRPGVCGNGRDVVGYRNAIFARNFQSIGGSWSGVRCVPGPMRVTLTVAGGQVSRVTTQVGGSWPSTDGRLTDLGVVPPSEASAYFFSLVPRLETSGGRDRLLIPAVLADEAEVVDPLFALVRDRSRADRTREQALQWLGMLDDPRARRMLHTVIEDANEANKVRSNAIFALSHGEPPASEFAYLRELYTRLDRDQLKESIHMGMQEDESVGGRWLIERAMDSGESLKLRKSALFWAGQREATPTTDLLRVYNDAREASLREHAIFVLSQRKDDASTEALLRIAREDRDTKMRGKALFWLAQTDDPRVRKLIADLVLKEP